MHEDLLHAVRESTEGAYDLLGELGHDASGTAFLARDQESGTLVVLVVRAGGDEIEVLSEIDPEVPFAGGVCVDCGRPTERWNDLCSGCNRPAIHPPARGAFASEESLLASARTASADTHEALGAIRRAVGSPIYFARELESDRLVGFVLVPDDRAGGELALTVAWEGAATPRCESPSAAAHAVVPEQWERPPVEQGGDNGAQNEQDSLDAAPRRSTLKNLALVLAVLCALGLLALSVEGSPLRT